MEFLLLSLLSGLIGVFLTVLFQDSFVTFRNKVIRWWRRFRSKPKQPPKPSENFRFGNLVVPWIVVDGDGELEYTPETILCSYEPREQELPQDLLEIRNQIKQQEEEKRRGGLPHHWNGPRYALDRYVIGRTDWEENLSLQLWFRPSDYFTFLATNMSLDRKIFMEGKPITVREKYLKQFDAHTPAKFFSNSFGLVLAVITSDAYLLISQRSNLTGSRPSQFNVSADEGLSRNLDRDERSGDAPDVFRCAIRGATEELNIGFKTSEITILSFGVDTQLSQWGFLAMAKTDRKAEEIFEWRASGVKDKWENMQLHAVPFEPNSVVQFVLSHGPWAPEALVCIYHTLVHEFRRQSVETAIKRVISSL